MFIEAIGARASIFDCAQADGCKVSANARARACDACQGRRAKARAFAGSMGSVRRIECACALAARVPGGVRVARARPGAHMNARELSGGFGFDYGSCNEAQRIKLGVRFLWRKLPFWARKCRRRAPPGEYWIQSRSHCAYTFAAMSPRPLHMLNPTYVPAREQTRHSASHHPALDTSR